MLTEAPMPWPWHRTGATKMKLFTTIQWLFLCKEQSKIKMQVSIIKDNITVPAFKSRQSSGVFVSVNVSTQAIQCPLRLLLTVVLYNILQRVFSLSRQWHQLLVHLQPQRLSRNQWAQQGVKNISTDHTGILNCNQESVEAFSQSQI